MDTNQGECIICGIPIDILIGVTGDEYHYCDDCLVLKDNA